MSIPGDDIVPDPEVVTNSRHQHQRASGSRLAVAGADGLASGQLVHGSLG
jgi:hypothetical protein